MKPDWDQLADEYDGSDKVDRPALRVHRRRDCASRLARLARASRAPGLPRQVLIADVDCTTDANEALCARFDVEGFPSIKYFNPPAYEAEDFEGERDYAGLSAFAKEELVPGCSVVTKSSCDEQQLAELEEVLRTPVPELMAELKTRARALATASRVHDDLGKNLQARANEKCRSAFPTREGPSDDAPAKELSGAVRGVGRGFRGDQERAGPAHQAHPRRDSRPA